MIPSSACPSWQPDIAANAAQEHRSYTTSWDTIRAMRANLVGAGSGEFCEHLCVMGARLAQLGQHGVKLIRLGTAHRDLGLREIDLTQEGVEIVARLSEQLARLVEFVELGRR